MRRRRSIRLSGLAALLALLSTTVAAAPTAEALLECAARNAPGETFSAGLRMTSTDAQGNRSPLQAAIRARRAASALAISLQVQAPPALAGTAVLIRETEAGDDMRLYLPAVGRVRRITGAMASQALLGTQFSYLDLKQLFGTVTRGTVEAPVATEIDGRAAYRLRILPAAEPPVPYAELQWSLDARHCLPLRVDFLDADGQLLKRLEGDADSEIELQGHHLLTRFVMRNPTDASQTEVELLYPIIDATIPASRFSPGGFWR